MHVAFTAKIQRVYHADGTFAYEYVRIPARVRRYIDMHAIGEFPSTIRLDIVPNDIIVNVSENSAKVIIEL